MRQEPSVIRRYPDVRHTEKDIRSGRDYLDLTRKNSVTTDWDLVEQYGEESACHHAHFGDKLGHWRTAFGVWCNGASSRKFSHFTRGDLKILEGNERQVPEGRLHYARRCVERFLKLHRRHGQGAFFFTLPRLFDFENYYHYLVFGSIKINWVISQIMKGMSNYQDTVQIKCNRCAFSCLRTNYTDNFTYVTYV